MYPEKQSVALKRAKLSCGLFMAIALLSANSSAKVAEPEAVKLGKELTPIGAIKSGNADGTIPVWEGGLISHSAYRADSEGRPVNPFPDDKPLFTIDASNYTQYSDKLSAGYQALLKTYPDTFKIPVYQTRRTASLPENIYKAAKQNALTAELIEGGNSVANYQVAVPFPIPQSGLEVIWNHIMRYRGGSVERFFAQAVVQKNGTFVPVKMTDQFVFPEYFEDGYDPDADDNLLFYYKQVVTSPARLGGNVLLVHETIDQVKEPRNAWVYNAGQRRVRRAPQVAYDGPGTAADGLRTSDNFDLYNGAPDRYDWRIVGKKEMYIPYNSYQLMDTTLTYEDIIKPGHMNPDHTRYELHRVWVVEATLKSGQKHVYAKRVFHVDEDTWQVAAVDHFDGRGELWRVSEAHAVQFPQANAPWYAAEAIYDLVARRYLVLGLSNEEKKAIEFGYKSSRKAFTPSALRRAGKR
ncbi:MAG: DUF1329 domain-containing protein [Pseudomonadales bacterium]|nr:DUF1329 domain-containing protein [Pseudomonadales bacterium]